MSIKKKIENENSEIGRKHETFISKGGDVASDKKEANEFINILLRMPTDMLKTIDIFLKKKPWTTRTQWIVEAIHDKLTKEG